MAWKPHREGQLGGVKDGACGNRGLAVAAIALLELAAAQLAASVMATVGAQKTHWAIAIERAHRSIGLRCRRARGMR